MPTENRIKFAPTRGCCRVVGEWFLCSELNGFVKLCEQHAELFKEEHRHWTLRDVTSDDYLTHIAMDKNGNKL